jgi:dihydroxynaphthoic acid synthetase
MTEYEEIHASVSAGVATITINRPDRLNAFRSETLAEMTHAVRSAGEAPGVGVIVLTGAGERAFSAGGDVEWEADGALEARKAEDEMKVLYRAMREANLPIIARVNGYAIGGGNHLAYMCDFTIASEASIFGQNGPRIGSPAQGWYVSYLVRVIGAKRAREMWMLCRRYTAQQMCDWGLINAVVPEAELDETVRTWCDEILALSPTVIKVVRQSFDQEFEKLREDQDEIDFLERTNPGFFASGEQMEGATAFLEKRPPDFAPYRGVAQ